MARKRFARDEPVEIIADSLGRRGRPVESDWTPATYVRGDSKARGWHYARLANGDERLVPLRRIRKPGGAS
jgi:hypothetical protein